MQLYRLFCIYFPTKDVVSGGNVDQEEQVQLLVSYKECLLGRCKTESKKAEFLRSTMRNTIIEELFDQRHENVTSEQDIPISEWPRFPSFDELALEEQDLPSEEELLIQKIRRHMVYNLCGYLLYSRKYLLKCEDCLNTLETSLELLPPDFYEAIATNRKDRGGLKYCIKKMFDLFIIVEEAYRAEVLLVFKKKTFQNYCMVHLLFMKS
jgi:hypothetical protein